MSLADILAAKRKAAQEQVSIAKEVENKPADGVVTRHAEHPSHHTKAVVIDTTENPFVPEGNLSQSVSLEATDTNSVGIEAENWGKSPSVDNSGTGSEASEPNWDEVIPGYATKSEFQKKLARIQYLKAHPVNQTQVEEPKVTKEVPAFVEPEVDAIDKLAEQAEVKPKRSLAEILKERREAEAKLKAEKTLASAGEATEADSNKEAESLVKKAEAEMEAEESNLSQTFALNIKLNDRQIMAAEYAEAGKSFVLMGAAGTGKTTTSREVARRLMKTGLLGTHNFKVKFGEENMHLDAPSIAFCAYTRRATNNIRRALHSDPELASQLKYNVCTVHRLLEYEPEEYYDAEKDKQSMRFVPRRDANNPLTITHLIIEEASMLGLDLWQKLYDALPFGVQIIYIGDINQLQPVFGGSILNYALVTLPVVELTEVYRQALDNPIIENAHRVLKGEMIEPDNKFIQILGNKQKEQVGQEKLSLMLARSFEKMHEIGAYDPDTDIILSPWNVKPCGTDNLNSHIAQFLGTKRQAMVYEILAGRRKLYLAVGDRVMFDKRDAIITKISHNGMYTGRLAQTAGTDLSRFGMRIFQEDANSGQIEDIEELDYSNFSLEQNLDEDAERKLQASHVVTIEYIGEDGETDTLSATGDFADKVFTLGYAITVHKSQGCEWKRVFVVMHKDHKQGGFLSRELLYTAMTRAREELRIIAKMDVLEAAIANQKIKGNSIEEKIEYFNGGALDIGAVATTK